MQAAGDGDVRLRVLLESWRFVLVVVSRQWRSSGGHRLGSVASIFLDLHQTAIPEKNRPSGPKHQEVGHGMLALGTWHLALSSGLPSSQLPHLTNAPKSLSCRRLQVPGSSVSAKPSSPRHSTARAARHDGIVACRTSYSLPLCFFASSPLSRCPDLAIPGQMIHVGLPSCIITEPDKTVHPPIARQLPLLI